MAVADNARITKFIADNKLTHDVRLAMMKLDEDQRARVMNIDISNVPGDKNAVTMKLIKDAKLGEEAPKEKDDQKFTYHFNNVVFDGNYVGPGAEGLLEDGTIGMKSHYESFVEDLVRKFMSLGITEDWMNYVKVSIVIHKNLARNEVSVKEKGASWLDACLAGLKHWKAHIVAEVEGEAAVKVFKDKAPPDTVRVHNVTATVFKADRAKWEDHLCTSVKEVVLKYATKQSADEVKAARVECLVLKKEVHNLQEKLEKLSPKVLEGSLDFDGNGAYAVVSNVPSLSSLRGFTLCAWIKADPQMWDGTHVLARRKQQFAFVLTDGNLQLWVQSAATNSWATEPGAESAKPIIAAPFDQAGTDKWTHVACSFDGDTTEIFVNGKCLATGPSAGLELRESTTQVAIGAGPEKDDSFTGGGKMSNFFKGCVTEVCIYKQRLNEDEVAEYMDKRCEKEDSRRDMMCAYLPLIGKETKDLNIGSIERTNNAGLGSSYWSSESPWDLENILDRTKRFTDQMTDEMMKLMDHEAETRALLANYQGDIMKLQKDALNDDENREMRRKAEAAVTKLEAELARKAKIEATVKALQGEKDTLMKKDAANTSKIKSQESELERLQQRVRDLEGAPRGAAMPMMMAKEVEWLKDDEVPGLEGPQACIAWCCLPAEHRRLFVRAKAFPKQSCLEKFLFGSWADKPSGLDVCCGKCCCNCCCLFPEEQRDKMKKLVNTHGEAGTLFRRGFKPEQMKMPGMP